MLNTPSRRLFFDLQVNEHGRYATVAQVSARDGSRDVVVLAAELWPPLHALLGLYAQGRVEGAIEGLDSARLRTEQSEGTQRRSIQLDGRSCSSGQRCYFFDLFQNPVGRYLRISQVKGQSRATVLLLEVCFQGAAAALLEFQAWP